MRKVILTGRLADNAKVVQGNGHPDFVSFRMACDEGYGEHKTLEWVDCTYMGVKLAPYLVKGAQVTAVGTWKLTSYQGKDGNTHTTITVRVSDLQLCSSGQLQGQADSSAATNNAPTAEPMPSGNGDDLPF